MPSVKALIIVFSTFLALVGCMRPEGINTADIDPLGWRKSDKAAIEVENDDTLSIRNLSLLFRFDNTLQRSSIPLTIKVTTPDSLWYEEDFTAVLANTIKTNHDFYEAVIPYRNRVVLSSKGRYIFEITNAGGEIRGIWGIGMIIE